MAQLKRPAAGNLEEVVITGVGLVTAVGFDAVSTAAAVRAGITRINTIPEFLTDACDEALGALALGLTDDRSGSDRLLCMAIPALQEALEQAEMEGDELPTERGGLLLNLPPADRPAYETFDAADTADLLELAECQGLKEVVAVPGGHASGLRAIAWGVERLQRGSLDFAIVGGVDCLLENPGLLWFDGQDRLRTAARGDGFVPGEAAAFLVLERWSDAYERGARALARIAGLGFGREGAPADSPKPSRAEGLSQALRAALEQSRLSPSAIRAVYCDLNAESYRMREWAMCQSRELPDWTQTGLAHPVENHGDLGAASGAALSALAITSLERGYLPPGPEPVLIWCSSDDGDRACLLLERSR